MGQNAATLGAMSLFKRIQRSILGFGFLLLVGCEVPRYTSSLCDSLGAQDIPLLNGVYYAQLNGTILGETWVDVESKGNGQYQLEITNRGDGSTEDQVRTVSVSTCTFNNRFWIEEKLSPSLFRIREIRASRNDWVVYTPDFDLSKVTRAGVPHKRNDGDSVIIDNRNVTPEIFFGFLRNRDGAVRLRRLTQ